MLFKRTIRLFLLLLLFFHLQAFRSGESQVVTLSFKEAPLQKVFAEIRKQTGYTFAYAEADLVKARPVNISVNNTRIMEALAIIFSDQPFSFTVIERVITIKLRSEKKIPQAQSSRQVYQVGIDVRGRVLNDRDDPVVGVSVQVKGTKHGTATNEDGEFELKGVESGATLSITGVNIQPAEVFINGRRSLEVKVQGKTGKLDEVQVIAYGKTSQRFNVGNVTTIKAEDIEKQPVNNPLLALQGRVPGLVVTQETGMNGGGVKVRIQGENSFRNRGNDPLIIIDGVPYPTNLPYNSFSEHLIGNGGEGSPLSFININDIESIDVLKDADATSIYGSRAANGAILITTKKGKPGKIKVGFNLQQGWSKVARKMKMMNTRQYLDMRYEAMRNAGKIPANISGQPSPYLYAPDLTIWDTTRFTDWQKVLIGETAQYSNFNASMAGGSSNTNYMVGITYNRSTDVFPGDHALHAGNVHLNLNTTSANNKFKLQVTATYNVSVNYLPGADLTASAIRLVPVAPPLFSADSINWAPNPITNVDTWDNPLGDAYYRKYKSKGNTLYSNILISYSILPGLELKSNFGYTSIQSQSNLSQPLVAIRPAARSITTRNAFFSTSLLSSLIVEPQISYLIKKKNLRIDALLGATIQQNNAWVSSLTGTGYTSDLLMEGIVGAASVAATMGKTNYKYAAIFSRAGIVLADRYLLSVNVRRDGSSRFGKNRRYHNFGSVGAGWIFSEMRFVKNFIPWFSFGKLRASYGTTGNDQIGDYQYLSNNTPVQSEILYQGVGALQSNLLSNPYLQWEDTRKLMAGIDIGLLYDKILLSISYGQNRSSNQLLQNVLPSVTGFSSITENFPATLQNTSWEFMLNTVNFKNDQLKWTSSINLTIPRNKVINFSGIERTSHATGNTGIIVGQPYGVIKLYSYAGLDPLTGAYLVSNADQGGGPVRDPDKLPYKLFSPVTPYYGGWQNAISYKGFQIDFLFQFVRQRGNRQFEYWNGQFGPGYMERGRGNQPVAALNRWIKQGDQAIVAPYSADANYRYTRSLGPLANSDVFYSFDASFIRLKNVSLSWVLPAKFISRVGLQSGRIYLQSQNLLTISQYTGLDPETQNVTNLPPLLTCTVGVQFGL